MSKPLTAMSGSDPLSGPSSLHTGSLMGPTGNVATISNPALAGSLSSDQIAQLSLGLERAAMFSGQIEKHFKAMAAQSKSMHVEARKTASEVKSSHKASAKSPLSAGPTTAQPGMSGFHPSPATRGETRASTRIKTAGAPEGKPDDEMPILKDVTNLGEIKQYGAARANRWMSQWGKKYQPGTDEAGDYLDKAGKATRASARAGSNWEQKMSRIGRAQGAVSALGAGEGAAGAFGTLGLKAAGPIGLAIGGVTMANNKMIDERKTNASYQNIFGGSNTEQYGQRKDEFIFSRFGAAGVMGSDEASELFKGVSKMGLQGDKRQVALDFALNQYKNSGMDVSASMSLIEQSTKNGTSSLGALSAALEGVSESAQKSGLSLKDVQAGFAENYKRTSEGITTTSEAASIAQGLTAIEASMGVTLQDVKLSGLLTSRAGQARAATRTGKSIPEIQTGLATGEGNMAGLVIEANLAEAQKVVVRGDGNGAAKAMADAKRKANGGGPLSNQDYAEIGIGLQDQGIYDQNAALQNLASMNFPGLNAGNIATFMAKWQLGEFDAANTMKAATEKQGGFKHGEATEINHRALVSNSPLDGHNRINQDEDLLAELGFKQNWFSQSPETNNDMTKRSLNSYKDYIHSDGAIRLKGVEKLLSTKISPQLGQDAKFQVKDKKTGQNKNVSLDEAVKSYSDQLEGGEVQITAGNKDFVGKKVGELTGVYDKDPAGSAADPAKKNGAITVTAAGDLDRFIKMQVSGGAGLVSARGNGVGAEPFQSPTSKWMADH